MKFRKLVSKILIIVITISIIYAPQSALAASKKVYVATQAELNAALKDSDVTQIVIKTAKKVKLTIPDGDYTDKRLYLKAPSAVIKLDGKNFKSVHTYVSTQTQLDKALKDGNIGFITINTNKKATLTIYDNDYSNKSLYINAPEATVVNNGEFKAVTAYVSSQEELNRVLANSGVTDLSIITDAKENFVVSKDYPDLIVTVNAPNATFTATGDLGKVNLQNAKNAALPKDKQPTATPEPSVTPEPITKPTDSNAGGGMGGGYIPSVPTTVPISAPTTVPTPTPTTVPIPTPTTVPTATPTPTPEPTTVDPLQSLKDEKVASLKAVIDAKLALIPASKTEILADDIQTANSLYNSIRIKDTEQGVIDRYNECYNYVTRPDIFIYNMTAQERQQMENADYNSFLSGSIPLTQLYAKYANHADGYLSAINVMDYTYAVVNGAVSAYKDPDLIAADSDNITGQISYYDKGTSFYYIDYKNNCTYMFFYDANHYANLPLNDYFNQLIDIIADGSYVNVASEKRDGCIVSFNTINDGVEIKNLTNLRTSTIITNLPPATKWTDTTTGKQYFSRQGDVSSQQTITAESTDGLGMINVVSGSAITYKFTLYMNDCTGISYIGVYNSTTFRYDPLDMKYYTISTIDPAANTATITFNTDFTQDYLTGKKNGDILTFIMFPSNYPNNGSGLNFYIRY